MKEVLKQAIRAIERIFHRAIASGNLYWIAVLVVGGIVASRMDSKDLSDVIRSFAGKWCSISYVVSVVVIYASVRTLKWRETIYQNEMARMAEVKNQALQGKTSVKLMSSKTDKDHN